MVPHPVTVESVPRGLNDAANLAAALACQLFSLRHTLPLNGGERARLDEQLVSMELVSAELQQTIRALQDSSGLRATTDRGGSALQELESVDSDRGDDV